MALSKKCLTVYGMSAEGYDTALKFSEKGFETAIIDERLNSPIKVHKKDFLKKRTVDEFFEEETLAEMASLEETISNSELLLYCPKIRCDVNEIYHQYEHSLKEISPILPKGSVLIFWAPLGQNGQEEIVRIIQKYINLKDNEYGIVFLPPFLDKEIIVGTFGKIENSLETLSDVIGRKVTSSAIQEAERVFFSKILERFSYYTSQMITFSGTNGTTQEHPYYDSLFSYYTDLKMIYNTTRRGTQLKSFSSSLIRIVDSYPKNLLNYVKGLTKEKNVKPSRARIIALWSRSNYYVRPDIERSSLNFASLLQDIFVDVQVLPIKELLQKKIVSTASIRNPTFIITCSSKDFDSIKDQVKEKSQIITVIKATLPPSRLT